MLNNLTDLAKPRRKSCGVALHLRNKANPFRHMVTGGLCGTWKCPTCGDYLRKKWVEHLTAKFQPLESVYISLVGKPRWQTVAKRILRASGDFATVEQSGDMLMVFTNVSMGEHISNNSILTLLTKTINNAETSSGHRPVHTSRGWALVKTPPKMSEWERIDNLPITVDEAEKVVKTLGLIMYSFWDDQRRGFVVDLPDVWVAKELEFNKLLEGPPHRVMFGVGLSGVIS